MRFSFSISIFNANKVSKDFSENYKKEKRERETEKSEYSSCLILEVYCTTAWITNMQNEDKLNILEVLKTFTHYLPASLSIQWKCKLSIVRRFIHFETWMEVWGLKSPSPVNSWTGADWFETSIKVLSRQHNLQFEHLFMRFKSYKAWLKHLSHSDLWLFSDLN